MQEPGSVSIGNGPFLLCQTFNSELCLDILFGDNSGDEQDQDGHVENSDGLVVMPRRQEPLVNLETLGLWGLWGDQTYVGSILSILGHCPNIVKMLTFDIDNEQGVQTIAEFIARECPRIRKLARSGSHYGGGAILTFRIMEALPAHHITELDMNQWHSVFNQPIVSPALLRHSTTLRFLNLQTTNGIARMPVAVIFENCVSLETLRTCEHRIGLYANLDDVQEAPLALFRLAGALDRFQRLRTPLRPRQPRRSAILFSPSAYCPFRGRGPALCAAGENLLAGWTVDTAPILEVANGQA
ncbi:hypothetical protein K457DRAFT_680337 [Linnemannia elongata AG-77]|uniref:RNI-like protein n=1 Tax=Linnemannia elongata AG-77 TaxID=1314771 RepID=A0A197JQV8_9FUNG|nr:hypothetical protein K457DRAFT_680337 [Linnemannia elongata AG-77]